MKTRIEKLENGNLRIHLPVALRCREGRRRIVPLDGEEKPQELPLAGKWGWKMQLSPSQLQSQLFKYRLCKVAKEGIITQHRLIAWN